MQIVRSLYEDVRTKGGGGQVVKSNSIMKGE